MGGRTMKNERGFAIIELMITMLILVLVVQAFAVFMRNVGDKNLGYRDKAFATQKAVQMLEELRAVVAGETGATSVAGLDDYDDTKYYRFTLTTDAQANEPWDYISGSDPLSANRVVEGQYKFVRKVIIQKVPNDPSVRKVWVRVFYADENSGPDPSSVARPRDMALPPLAEVFSIVQTVGTAAPPTQVMDVFLVAIENIPGWWVRPAELRPMVASALNNLQARNPGLQIRERWIRRLAYGRDPEYSPEITLNPVPSEDPGAYSRTYIYPGWTAYDDGSHHFYLDPYWMKGRVHVRNDPSSTSSSDFSGSVTDAMWLNQNYSMADQWNHAVRYPEELAIYNRLSQDSQNPPEISLRMLQEGMNAGDPKYLNSIVLNLHGELVPVVPLRNYSDPAKDPAWFYRGSSPRAFRAVSHFEQLHFDTATEEVAFRVYAYNAEPAGSVEGDQVDITLFLPNVRAENIERIERVLGDSSQAYHWQDVTASLDRVNLPSGLAGAYEVDEITPAGSSPGLRIRLLGVSTTARECVGCTP